jgi:hypothetical protein
MIVIAFHIDDLAIRGASGNSRILGTGEKNGAGRDAHYAVQ